MIPVGSRFLARARCVFKGAQPRQYALPRRFPISDIFGMQPLRRSQLHAHRIGAKERKAVFLYVCHDKAARKSSGRFSWDCAPVTWTIRGAGAMS